MNSDSDDSHIADLLRSKKPAVSPPADLEARIHAKLARCRPAAVASRWPWFAATAAAACLALWLVVQRPQDQPEFASAPVAAPVSPPSAPPGFTIDLSLADPAAPLQAEGGAIARDLGRARGFLLNCLPTAGGADFQQ